MSCLPLHRLLGCSSPTTEFAARQTDRERERELVREIARLRERLHWQVDAEAETEMARQVMRASRGKANGMWFVWGM